MVVRTPVASRHLRDASARLVLDHLWDVDEVTGSALIEATGLSRATVHDVCDELIEHGWVTELESQRTGTTTARDGPPAGTRSTRAPGWSSASTPVSTGSARP